MSSPGATPSVTAVVRSKDEAPRLRLTLASLARQTVPIEVVVVDDGSSDETTVVIEEAARSMAVIGHRNPSAMGRTAASNLGAAKAAGDILLFMDGDVLAAPDLVERHLAAHGSGGDALVRGETWHLRQTRLLRDPEAGTPMPGEEQRVASMPGHEIDRARVTREQVQNGFDSIRARGQPGIYPGAGPRRLYEIEIDALLRDADCPVNWAAASGHNLSVRRDAFLAVGGFHESITINEHRLLALSLAENGLPLRLAEGARSFHMTHQRGWRDPLQDADWLRTFYQRYPYPEVALLPIFWGSLADAPIEPAAARIPSLPALYDAARRLDRIVGLNEVVEAHLRTCAALAPA